MNILIVDDHNLFREGLRSLLTSHPDLSIAGEAGTVREAIKKALELEPDLVLMDISLPDGSGLDALKGILARRPKTKVVMLTIHETDDLLLTAIRNGAIGYILKNTPTTELVKSIRALERGEAALSHTMTTRIVEEFQRVGKIDNKGIKDLNILTARESEVLKFLSTGATNQEIAGQLFISENTVKVHVHNILNKLNLRNRREATKFAQRYDLGFPPTKKSRSNNR